MVYSIGTSTYIYIYNVYIERSRYNKIYGKMDHERERGCFANRPYTPSWGGGGEGDLTFLQQCSARGKSDLSRSLALGALLSAKLSLHGVAAGTSGAWRVIGTVRRVAPSVCGYRQTSHLPNSL